MSDTYYDNTAGNQSAMEYGLELDPYTDENPYKALNWRSTGMNNLFKTMGIYPEDLLGLPDEPTMPEGDRFVSDYVTAMGSNPLLLAVVEGMQMGKDPGMAAAQVIDQAGDQGSGVDAEALAGQAVQYATGLAEQTRKQGDWDSQMAEYEAYDKPTVDADKEVAGIEDMIKWYSQGRLNGNVTTPNVEGGVRPMPNRPRERNVPDEYDGILERSIGVGTRSGPGGPRQSRPGGPARMGPPQPNRQDKMTAAAYKINQETQRKLNRAAADLQLRQRQGPSPREQANRQRAALMWQLSLGLPAPRN